MIDVGFQINVVVPLKGIRKPEPGETVESVKKDDVYTFRRSDSPPRELYAFKALVERVVDGDSVPRKAA
ncbi:MAG: hypothetical protein ABH852_03315 [Methanobacteriota archaeon]